ncbi:hypothetical protein PC116_g21312 [Phytophthora cactorum]|nr:hypothetical protein Pcac1_g28500 [Phytophthora cactorum]KAG3145018.1 hypothetical protein C6341_g18545 [Phytophthora cactorum]KAG4230383.1 hypothetical protein PC116_g21312 [Phytophthora cactorum]
MRHTLKLPAAKRTGPRVRARCVLLHDKGPGWHQNGSNWAEVRMVCSINRAMECAPNRTEVGVGRFMVAGSSAGGPKRIHNTYGEHVA